jgi:hypothetical protein
MKLTKLSLDCQAAIEVLSAVLMHPAAEVETALMEPLVMVEEGYTLGEALVERADSMQSLAMRQVATVRAPSFPVENSCKTQVEEAPGYMGWSLITGLESDRALHRIQWLPRSEPINSPLGDLTNT